MRITIIDSGLGGITFSKNLNKELEFLEISLMIDYEGFPYGDKDLVWLKERLITLVDSSPINTVIIACNTLSSIIYNYDLIFDKQVVDVITPTIYFLLGQKYNKIVILATKNTIKTNIYKMLLENVIYIDASKLISDLQNNLCFEESLKEILNSIPSDCDYLLLGCTHLIYIKDIIREKTNINVISQDEIFISLLKSDFI
jgi:glutamate racemase